MTNFLNKINQLDAVLEQKEVHAQVQELNKIVATVKQRAILPVAPRPLGFLPDELAVLSEQGAPADQLKIINQLLNSLRQFLSINYGLWSLPNKITATAIKQQLNVHSALEIMAGNACWTKALTGVGIATVATDSLEWSKTSSTGSQPFSKVLQLDASDAIKQFNRVDLILCSWAPNFNQADLAAVRAWERYNPSAHLLFIGEKNGVTNSKQFWQKQNFNSTQELKLINQTFLSYDFINEQIFEIEHEI
ncbi:SAM-dependent methyltransferase [Lactobacillus sp. ESL0681]|uniref:SAM-dependent methyltransferase n=1 Tax=Lactobacillus sp. ESL0681 TaxID=2983211 RepID=UPI0023F7AF6E|nr:SAM-dependent methyltransferase [Lactobacillus sp. ESL0681]WEV40705.1 SAM-dependent methyltransferase [Lactobacillus sp. ESL0681]